MQKYLNNVVNAFGVAIEGASVLVTAYPAGTTSVIYSDDGITPKVNPILTDENGYFEFYAADGRYSLAISGLGITSYTITNFPLGDPETAATDAAASAAAALVSQTAAATSATSATASATAAATSTSAASSSATAAAVSAAAAVVSASSASTSATAASGSATAAAASATSAGGSATSATASATSATASAMSATTSATAAAASAASVAGALALKQDLTGKDASGGYVGMTLFKHNFLNALGTFVSFFTNSNTAARTYTFQDRDGTIADDTDLALKQATSGKDATGGYVGMTLFKHNFKNAANTFTSFFTNSNTAARTYTFQDRDGTVADDTDLALKQATSGKDATGGYAGLTLFKINFKNAANTFTSFFTNANTAARTYTFKDADGTVAFTNDIGTAGALASDTDGTLSANSDTRIPTQKAMKTYVDTTMTGVYKLKGSTDCSSNPNYPAAVVGDAYVVTVAGKIGGASGVAVDIGDMYVASAVNIGGTQAAVGASWFVLEHDLVGALLSANNLSDVASASSARTNIAAEGTANKDATGGYAGLTLFKINFKNAANTFTNFFTNATTAARTYTFQDRDGTIADDTDLGLKQSTSGKDATGGYAGLTLFKINFKNAANTFTNFFTNATTAARTYTFQDRDGTIADNTDLALKANLAAPAIAGGSHTALTGLGIRTTGAAFDLTLAIVEALTAGRTLTFKVNDAARTVDIAGNFTLAGAFTTSGAYASTFTMTNTTTVTFPTSGTLATLAGTETLTNKRVNPRVSTTASSTTPTPNADTDDEYTITALAGAPTFGAPTGTPVEGQNLVIRIKDNGTARALAYNAIYRASSDLALPATTVLSKTLYLGFKYNATDSKWDLLAVLNNF